MALRSIYHIEVMFGDCDPAGIVFYPNFQKWMDAAQLHLFRTAGIPPWRELERQTGVVGTPLLEIQTRFMRSATYGEKLQVHSWVSEWKSKVFVVQHQVMREEVLLCEGSETRAWCVRHPDDPARLKSVVIPDAIRACLS